MALSTAITWTNQDVVDFVAGTLSTINACITYVETKLRRGTLSASTTPSTTEVQSELIRAKEELCEIMGFTWQRKYAYSDTVAGQFRYNLPDDYSGLKSLRDITNDRQLRFVDSYRFDTKFADPSEEDNDESDVFTIKDRELWIAPPSAGTYRIELEYSRSGTDATATDISYLPEPMRFKICDFAIYQSFLSLHQFQEAQLYKGEWMNSIRQGKRADGKKKWANTGFQAMTWQQEYNARNYQA